MPVDKPLEFIKNHPRLVVAQDFEVVCQRFSVESVEYSQGSPTLRESQDLWWIRLRVIHRNKPGIATATLINEDCLNRLVDNALLSAEQSHPDPWFRFPIWTNTGTAGEGLKESAPEAFLKSRFCLVGSVPKTFSEKYEWWNVETLIFRRSEREQKRFTQAAGHQSWSLGGLQESFWDREEKNDRLRNFIEAANLFDSCQTLSSLPLKAISFSPRAAAPLLEQVAEFFFATKVDSENSPFKRDQLNQSFASPSLSLYDDGLDRNPLSYAPFDLDGIASQKTVLVDRGVLKGFLYDSYSGLRDNCRSTGNSLRGPQSVEARIKPRKVVLAANGLMPDAFWSKYPTGLAIEGWSRMEMNEKKEVTGGVFGWLIEGGQKIRPVKIEAFKISLSQFLSQIVGTGPEAAPFGGCQCPTVFVEGIQ